MRNYELERVYKEGEEALKKLREKDQHDPIVKYVDEILNVNTRQRNELSNYYDFFKQLKRFIGY